jgi:hypothetical protein
MTRCKERNDSANIAMYSVSAEESNQGYPEPSGRGLTGHPRGAIALEHTREQSYAQATCLECEDDAEV